MHYLFLCFLAMSLVSCSAILKDEKEIEKVLEDIVHEELSQAS